MPKINTSLLKRLGLYLPFGQKLLLPLLFTTATAISGCSGGASTSSSLDSIDNQEEPTLTESEADNSESTESADDSESSVEIALRLPNELYNYANIELPDYYVQDQFPDNVSFTRPVTFFDNTPEDNPITDAGATLGRVLFYDKTLSANGSTSCASCHSPATGFSDSDTLSLGFEGRAKTTLDGTEARTGRHSMSLANSRFYYGKKFFWDERAETLEDQVLMPFQDEVEMGLTLDELEQLVRDQDYYPELFAAAFGDTAEIDSKLIARALAQFVRSMVSVTSRYDQAREDVDSPFDDFPDFTAAENAGKRLFFIGKRVDNAANPSGMVNCQSCHTTEAFITAVPDDAQQLALIDSGFTSTTSIGLDAVITDDFGVGESSGRSTDNGKFKVPSLKNIGVSAPYMHDGRFATLEDVVDHYSRDIEDHENLSPPLVGANGQPIRFRFTQQEKNELIAFLHTLTDNEMLTDDKYSDPFVD